MTTPHAIPTILISLNFELTATATQPRHIKVLISSTLSWSKNITPNPLDPSAQPSTQSSLCFFVLQLMIMGGHLFPPTTTTTTFQVSPFPTPLLLPFLLCYITTTATRRNQKTKEMMMKKPQVPLLIFFFLYVLLLTARAQDAAGFNCSSPTTTKCDALIDYVAPDTTTLSDIKALFGVRNLRSILGANSLPLLTPPNQTVAAKQTIKVPFECVCDKGRGVSNKRPVYKVKAGDGLDHIARDVFSALVTYQQIQAVNDIKNASLILVGQELRIPLPCSCDDVDGMEVVHYGHVVAPGSSVQQIAEEYGTKEDTLLRLNGLADPKLLMAGSVLDVPLRACASSVSNQSRDYPLRVSNGTNVFTAHNCVQCNCASSNNWTLQCKASPPGIKVSEWDKCPSMTCQGTDNLSIGNSSSSSSCETTTCSYAGYDDKAILTTLSKTSTCNSQGAPGSLSPGNYATKIGLHGFSWSWVLPSANLGLLCFGYLFW